MKNCDEMLKSLLERRDNYVAEKKRKRKVIMRATTSVCCVCLVALLSFGVWQTGKLDSQPPVILDDSIIIGEKDYISPDELESEDGAPSESGIFPGDEGTVGGENAIESEDESASDSEAADEHDRCDVLGMVVIDGATYLQYSTDGEAYTPDIYLGYASDYDGTYKTHIHDVVGELYTAKEDANILIVKLSNGGTVILRKTDHSHNFT